MAALRAWLRQQSAHDLTRLSALLSWLIPPLRAPPGRDAPTMMAVSGPVMADASSGTSLRCFHSLCNQGRDAPTMMAVSGPVMADVSSGTSLRCFHSLCNQGPQLMRAGGRGRPQSLCFQIQERRMRGVPQDILRSQILWELHTGNGKDGLRRERRRTWMPEDERLKFDTHKRRDASWMSVDGCLRPSLKVHPAWEQEFSSFHRWDAKIAPQLQDTRQRRPDLRLHSIVWAPKLMVMATYLIVAHLFLHGVGTAGTLQHRMDVMSGHVCLAPIHGACLCHPLPLQTAWQGFARLCSRLRNGAQRL